MVEMAPRPSVNIVRSYYFNSKRSHSLGTTGIVTGFAGFGRAAQRSLELLQLACLGGAAGAVSDAAPLPCASMRRYTALSDVEPQVPWTPLPLP